VPERLGQLLEEKPRRTPHLANAALNVLAAVLVPLTLMLAAAAAAGGAGSDVCGTAGPSAD
jgi:hypothetical protein